MRYTTKQSMKSRDKALRNQSDQFVWVLTNIPQPDR